MNKYSREIVKCSQCHKEFLRRHYHVLKTKKPFCGLSCYAEWQSIHNVGKNNPNYRPDSHALFECSWCGKSFEDRILDRKRGSKELTFCCRDHFLRFARQHWRGNGNPSWKGGNPRYYGLTWKVMRKKALERDNHICQDCGSKDNLVVHHKREFSKFQGAKEANVLDNLLTLCIPCHLKFHNYQK